MKTLATIAVCLSVATPVLAQSVGEKTGVNSLLGVTPSTQDFVTEAAASDMFEIQSSQMAVERADEPTKRFARQMITDHQKTSTELKSLIQAGTVKVTLPTEMASSQKSMLEKLRGLNGADFTKQYHSDQVSAHKDAVSLFQRYGKGGDNEQLRSWTGKTVPALEHHLQMAQDLDK